MNLSIFPGHVLVSRDPLVERTHKGVVLPAGQERLATSGLCLLHEPGLYWTWWGGEPPLTGRRLVFSKFAGRPVFLLGPKGTGLEMWVLPEDSILAVEEAE